MLEYRVFAVTLMAAVARSGVVPSYPQAPLTTIAKITSPLPYAAPRLTYVSSPLQHAQPITYAAPAAYAPAVAHAAPLAYAPPTAYAPHATPVAYATPTAYAHAAPVAYAAPTAYAAHAPVIAPAAPVAYAAPTAYAAHAPVYAHAAPVAYASPTAYASHAPVVAHAAPVAYAAPTAYAAHAPIVAQAPSVLKYAAAPAYAKAVVPTAVDTDYDPNPSYNYAYDIQDALTGDSKNQQESRQGDVVQGSYSLTEPDGTRRTVEYTADPVNGFNAVVHREPATVQKVVTKVAAPVAVVAQPHPQQLTYAAPVQYAAHSPAIYSKTLATYH